MKVDRLQQKIESETKKVKQLYSEFRNLKYIRQLLSKNKQLKTDLTTNKSNSSSNKNLKQQKNTKKISVIRYVVCQFKNVIHYVNTCCPTCMLSYTQCMGSGILDIRVMTVSRHGFRNGKQRAQNSCETATFLETIFSHLRLKPSDRFLPHSIPEILLKLKMANRRRVNFESGCRINGKKGNNVEHSLHDNNLQKFFLSVFIYRLNRYIYIFMMYHDNCFCMNKK